MLQRLLAKHDFEKEICAVAIFITGLIMHSWFNAYDFSLHDPEHLYISEATLNGVDINQRVGFYFKSILLGTSLFFTAYLVLERLFRWLSIQIVTKQILILLSVTGIALTIISIYGVTANASMFLMFDLISLVFIFSLVANFWKGIRYIIHPIFISAIFSLSFIVLSLIMFLLSDEEIVYKHIHLVYSVLTLLLTFLFVLLKQQFKIKLSKLFLFSLPFVSVPILIFIITETFFYFRLNRHFDIHYKLIFGIGLVSIFVVSFIIQKFKSSKYNLSQLLSIYYIPSALISFLILSVYHPLQALPTEFYELSNSTNAQLRLWKFHEIPCLDFMSSHMLSEQYGGIIYHLIFGYKEGYDFLVYSFFDVVLFYLITYFFCVRILKQPILSLLFVMAFPFMSSLFNETLFYSILILFLVHKLISNQSTKNYLLLLVLVFCSILWKLDLGSAIVISLFFYLPFVLFAERKKLNLNSLLKGSSIFIGLVLILLVVLLLFRPFDSIYSNFQSALHYLSANQAHGYASLSAEMNQQFYFYHFLLPLFSLVAIFGIIYFKRIKSQVLSVDQQYLLNASLFFYIMVLANFQRGLVRHGFMENNDSFLISMFYLATALLGLSLFNKMSDITKYILFFGFSFFGILILSYFPISKDNRMLELFLTNHSFQNFSEVFKRNDIEGRCFKAGDQQTNNQNDFRKFLDSHLKEDQTFLDFSNSPILYSTCQRRVPSYFCQSLQNTIDGYTQKQQLKRLDTSMVPVVVYSNYPLNWFDATDQVPNAMRYYYLAEFIYKNYKPFGIIDHKSVWILKSLNWDASQYDTDTLILKPQTFQYKKAALAIQKYYANQSNDKLKPIFEEVPKFDSSVNKQLVNCSAELNHGSILVKIIVSNPNGSTIILNLKSGDKIIGSFTFESVINEYEYMIRLSNQYAWFEFLNKSIEIETSDGIKISKLIFFTEQGL